MCRIAAYLGPPLSLQQFLLAPRHSLYRQSWQPCEMHEAVVNADGFGFGWQGHTRLERYLSASPVWNDINLPTLARCLRSPLWGASVRSATPGQTVHALNSQPLFVADWLFLHNGFIENFDTELRTVLYRKIPAEILATMHGNNDSAFLAALLAQKLTAGKRTAACSLTNLHAELPQLLGKRKALLNLLLCRHAPILAVGPAIAMPCPSLYVCHDITAFPRASLCASEAFDDDNWQAVPEHTLVYCTAKTAPRLQSLAEIC